MIALVPMRAGSKRIPGKNWAPIDGKPLFFYILSELQAASEIEAIIVDSDSQDLLVSVNEFFPRIRTRLRPSHLGSDDASMVAVLQDLLNDPSAVPESTERGLLQVHATSPMLSASLLTSAVNWFRANPQFDSLIGVTEVQKRCWTGLGEAINHNPDQTVNTQELLPVLVENSCIFIFEPDLIREHGRRIGFAPTFFPIPFPQNLDIDTSEDLLLARLLLDAGGESLNATK